MSTTANLFTWDKLYSKIPGSSYFTWAEALWLPQVSAFANPSIEQQMNIMKLATALEPVRKHYNRPITVTSWLRPDAYNKMIGGATFSFHKSGLAIDFIIPGLNTQTIKQELYQNKALWPYRGELDVVERIHLDLGGNTWFNGPIQRKTK